MGCTRNGSTYKMTEEERRPPLPAICTKGANSNPNLRRHPGMCRCMAMYYISLV